MLNHIRKHCTTLVHSYGRTKLLEPDTHRPENVVTSLLPNGNHGVCLDIDLPCELIPSKTPGHYHLYIEKELTWPQYGKLLEALAHAGIIESGWFEAAKKTKCTILRIPSIEYEFEKIRSKMENTGMMFDVT